MPEFCSVERTCTIKRISETKVTTKNVITLTCSSIERVVWYFANAVWHFGNQALDTADVQNDLLPRLTQYCELYFSLAFHTDKQNLPDFIDIPLLGAFNYRLTEQGEHLFTLAKKSNPSVGDITITLSTETTTTPLAVDNHQVDIRNN